MSIDWRALAAELAAELERCRPLAEVPDCLARARAALAAKPVGEGVTLQLPEQAPDEHPPSNLDRREVAAWYHGHGCGWQAARAVLARYTRQPAPPAAGELGELAVFLRGCADDHYGQGRRQFARAAELLERLASPACVVVKPSPELIEAFKDALTGRIEPLPDDAQVIKPAERTVLVPALQPVSVSERPWEREGWCDETGRCWWGRAADEFCNHDWHYATRAEVDDFCSDAMPQVTLPATALPLPQGEVQ